MCAARILPVTADALGEAAHLLRQGRLVAFPTETVYGLGGDATNNKAVAAIYAAKGRPQFNPLIIHMPTVEALEPLIEWTDTARILAAAFWPGPMTLVLPRSKNCGVSRLASAGLDTLAVRIPSHPIAQELLHMTGLPVAAPSANSSGRLSPTTPMHVAESLGDKVDLILAGGKCQVGVESTVINLTGSTPEILRPGGVTREKIEQLIGPVILAISGANTQALLAPGMMASHYAPHLPLRLNATNVETHEALLIFGPPTFVKGGMARFHLSESGDMEEAAANLFSMLNLADHSGAMGIAVTPVPEIGLGLAINDRLKRASIR